MKRLLLINLFVVGMALAQAKVYVNQCGYLPSLQKMAYTDQVADSFFVVRIPEEEIVFKGKWTIRKNNDPSTGLDLWQADFTAWDIPGRYVVENEQGDRSAEFSLSDTALSEVTLKSLKGLFYQRCGMALDAAYAGSYAHGSGHTTDGLFHSSCDTSGFMNVKGGWHDAGDYGKYVVPAANAAGTLLMLAEWFPDYLSTDGLNIPESGNSTPDLLDETRYELEWMLRMQDPRDGGLFFKVTTKNFVGWVMPQNSHETRYIYEKSSAATAGFAAVMARSARVFSVYDTAFSQTCRTAAEKAWNYLQAHPSIVPAGGFSNPADTETGEYGDEDDRDERLWAAAELFETTGENQYNQYVQAHYQDTPLFEEQMGWSNEEPMALLTYLKATQPGVDLSVQATIRSALYGFCDDQVALSGKDGFRVAMEGWEYYWGSNSVLLNKAILLIMGYEEGGNTDYRTVAWHQLNYILGTNGHNMTFVTDVGTRRPHHIHHAPSAADGVDEPVPGLLAGGPNKYLNDPELQSAFTSSTPPAMCYLDVLGSYASNEITIYWNAPLVFVAAYFNAGHDGAATLPPSESVSLQTFILEQNYPNPFNPATVITYQLPRDVYVRLSVFNILGKKVATLVHKKQSAGRHTVRFNAADLADGVYFYRLEAGNENYLTKKMVLLR